MVKQLTYNARLKGGSLILALAVALSAIGLQAPSVVQASGGNAPQADEYYTMSVDNYGDNGSDSACTNAPNDCSLRGAINRAAGISGAVSIYLPAGGYSLYGNASENKNNGGDLDLLKAGSSITLVGESMDGTTLNGTNNDRIFDIPDSGNPTHLILKNMTLRNGNAGMTEDGGAIRTHGELTLDMVAFANNYGRDGGAIFTYPAYSEPLTITRSVFTRNTAALDGGAVYAWGTTATISNSSFDYNKATGVVGVMFNNDKAGRGGAVYNRGNITVSNSTFFANLARYEGGGVLNYAFLGEHANAYINNSTFSHNSTGIANVSNGKGTYNTSAVSTIANSIFNYSTETENCVNTEENEGMATIINGGSNLDSGVSCGFGTNAGSIFGVDPKLGGYENNGGPTPTMALQSGSPAIDKGNPSTCIHRDQRGLSSTGVCDIGAFEYDAGVNITPTVAAGGISISGGGLGKRLQVMLTNQYGNPLEGWDVSFEIPDGVIIPVSGTSARTNRLGLAWIYADNAGLLHDATINVRVAGAIAWFMANQYGFYPKAHSRYYLPVTGFEPNRTTQLPQQTAGESYKNEGDLSLSIPKLKVNMPIIGIPKTNDGWNTTWVNTQAGYLEGTAFPTWKGNSVLTSHVYLADGTPGPFAQLNKLGWGDRIVVNAYGSSYIYEVRSVKSVKPDDLSVIEHKDDPWITLITCQDFDPASHSYLKRLAVSAALVQVSTP